MYENINLVVLSLYVHILLIVDYVCDEIESEMDSDNAVKVYLLSNSVLMSCFERWRWFGECVWVIGTVLSYCLKPCCFTVKEILLFIGLMPKTVRFRHKHLPQLHFLSAPKTKPFVFYHNE